MTSEVAPAAFAQGGSVTVPIAKRTRLRVALHCMALDAAQFNFAVALHEDRETVSCSRARSTQLTQQAAKNLVPFGPAVPTTTSGKTTIRDYFRVGRFRSSRHALRALAKGGV